MKTRNTEAASEAEQIRCWGENQNAQMVRFEKGDGSFQIHPYGCLECVQFSATESEDKLVVGFDGQEVRITGRGLRKLALLFQRTAVDWIKELPDRFDSLGSDEETIVSAIEIISKAEEEKKPV